MEVNAAMISRWGIPFLPPSGLTNKRIYDMKIVHFEALQIFKSRRPLPSVSRIGRKYLPQIHAFPFHSL